MRGRIRAVFCIMLFLGMSPVVGQASEGLQARLDTIVKE
jgi:hypothetical protein